MHSRSHNERNLHVNRKWGYANKNNAPFNSRSKQRAGHRTSRAMANTSEVANNSDDRPHTDIGLVLTHLTIYNTALIPTLSLV